MLLPLLFSVTSLFSSTDLSAQQQHRSLNDSIHKYKEIDTNKAIDFAFEAISLYSEPTILLTGTYAALGGILLDNYLIATAISYFSLALKTFEAVPVSERIEKNINKPPWVLVNLGNLYFRSTNRDFEKAKKYYTQAEENFLLFDNEHNKQIGLNTVYGNLGLIAIADKDFVLAEKYYLKELKSRKQLKDTGDLIYSYVQLINLYLIKGDLLNAQDSFLIMEEIYQKEIKGNKTNYKSSFYRNYGYAFTVYGAYYQSRKEYKKAIESLTKAKEILINFKNEIPALNSRIAQCYLGLNNLSKAKEMALENLKVKDLNPVEKKYNFKVLEKVYLAQDLKNNLLSIKDSLISLSGLSISNRVLNEFNSLETEILLSKKQNELNQNIIKYNTYLSILIIGSSILFFSLVSMRVNYNYQKEKNSRLKVEQQLVEKELEKKQIELVSKTNYIAQRNEYLATLKENIEKQEKKGDSNYELSKNIKSDINRIIGSEKVFEDFENQFTKVYPEFFKVISIKYGKLSPTDLRLAAYIKMNQSNSQIAQITGASIRTLETQRYRLSKKLNIQKGQDLNSVIISI